jgi:hypothetical protein
MGRSHHLNIRSDDKALRAIMLRSCVPELHIRSSALTRAGAWERCFIVDIGFRVRPCYLYISSRCLVPQLFDYGHDGLFGLFGKQTKGLGNVPYYVI